MIECESRGCLSLDVRNAPEYVAGSAIELCRYNVCRSVSKVE